MIVAEDAGVVAVIKTDLHGVIAYLGCGLSPNLGFEHRQRGRRNRRRLRAGVMMFLAALFVAGGTGAFVAEIGKIVMTAVIVGPGDVHAGARGNVNFDGERFFAMVDRDGHAS